MAKILLVDDNKITIDTYLEIMCREVDFKVVGVAYNGFEAIEYLKQKSINIVILDIIMPKFDGIEVLKYINNMSIKPYVIVTSIIDSENIIKEILKFDFLYYLLKPFDLQILIKRIREIFSQSRYNFLVKEKINNYLYSIGIPCKMKGYDYIRRGIEILIRNNAIKVNVNFVYSELSKKYNLSMKAIEKGIRDAIEATFDRGSIDYINKIFSTQISGTSGKVTNKTFLYTISNNIISELKYKEKID